MLSTPCATPYTQHDKKQPLWRKGARPYAFIYVHRIWACIDRGAEGLHKTGVRRMPYTAIYLFLKRTVP